MSGISRMGQYIRLPLDIETRKETFTLSNALGISRAETIMLLIRFLAWCDQNADFKKVVTGVTKDQVDEIVRHEGFSEAVEHSRMVMFNANYMQVQTDLLHHETQSVRLEKREKNTKRQADFREKIRLMPVSEKKKFLEHKMLLLEENCDV